MIKRHIVGAAPPPPVGVSYAHASEADGWLYVTGWLCDRFFTANDDAMFAKEAGAALAVAAASRAVTPSTTPSTAKETSLA